MERYEYKNKKFDGLCSCCVQKRHLSKDCWAWKNVHYKNFDKAERAINGDEDDLVLCLLTSESKKEIKKKKGLCGRC